MTTTIKNGTIVTADLTYKSNVQIEGGVPEWAAAGTDVLLHEVPEVAGVVG